MNALNNIKLSIKLPAIIAVLTIFAAAMTGGLGFLTAKESLTAETRHKLEAVLADRSASLSDWLHAIAADIETQSQNPATLAAVEEFSAAWNALEGDASGHLQDWYINRNPNPTGAKENLNYAQDGSAYSKAHAEYHPFFRRLMRDRGYHDIFLFDKQGNLVYSVYKERDFATNFANGPFAQSDLGEAFRTASNGGETAFFDFKPYQPSNNDPASFFSHAIKDANGRVAGVIAFRAPVDRLNRLMARTAGLGETGETYVVGQDFLMRSNSRFSNTSTILKSKVETDATRAALSGEAGVSLGANYRDHQSFSVYRPVEFGGVTWALVAEQEAKEVFAPAQALASQLVIQIIATSTLLSVIGFFIARGLSRPLSRLGEVMGKVAKGDLSARVPFAKRQDEIGSMAKTLTQFRDELRKSDNAKEALFKSSAFEESSSAMMMVDRDFNVTYVNKSTEDLLHKHADAFRELFPTFDADKIIGVCIDVFHKNPAHQRQLLSDPGKLPFRTDITIGDLKINLNVGGVFDENGDYVGNLLEWADVTADRLNAGKLDAVDRSQAVIEFDLKGNIQYANENFLAVTGYGLADIVGKHHSIFCDPEYVRTREYSDFWQKLARGEFEAGKYQRFDRNGNEVWIQASYNPVLDGNGKPFKVVKFASDVTEVEHMTQRAAKEQEERSAEQTAIVDALSVGMKALSEGNLTARITADFPPAYVKLRADFNDAVDRLQEAMGSVVTTSSALQTNANEISQAADDLSKRTENQAASLEQTAASLDEITATVNQTADGAKKANSVVTDTKADAEESGEIVSRAVAAMGEIENSSEQISQIIGVIDEIAFQTNLLALNAGVEAARAGEAGRGFAVVASEVRALAQRSSDAAKEIKDLISTSSQQVGSGVDLVGQAGVALEKIASRITEVSNHVADIATAAQEQANGLGQINTAINQMDQVTQQNAAMVEESTAAAHSMNSEASDLVRLVSHFQTGAASQASAASEQRMRATSSVSQQQKRVAEAFSAPTDGANALQPQPASGGGDDDGWEEF